MCSPAPSAPFQTAGRRVQSGGGGDSSREAQQEMAAMLESGSMDNLLLRMVAPMLHRVVAILFMAGLVHGRKIKEIELKVGLGKEQPGLLPLAASLHAFPPRPAVLLSCLALLHIAECRPVCFMSSNQPTCCTCPLFAALQRHKAKRQQLRMHGLHGLPRLKSLHPPDAKGVSGAGALPQIRRLTPQPAHPSQMNGDAHAVRVHLT